MLQLRVGTRCLTLAISLVLCALSALAQYEKGFKIKLPPATMPNNDPNRLFSIDSVYAAFPDTASIGVIYRSGIGKFAVAYVQDGTAAAIMQSLFTHFPHLKPEHAPVRMRIETLTYNEDPTQGYELEAELTFLRQDSTKAYVPFYKASLDAGVDGFGRGATIMEQVNRAILAMNTYLNDPVKQPAYLDDYQGALKQAVVDMKVDSARYDGDLTAEDNLQTCRTKRAGIYLSEKDMSLNRPGLVGTLNVQSKGDGKFVLLRRPNNRLARYRFAGFCTDDALYIHTNRYGGRRGRYVRVQDVGRYLLWRDDYVTMSEMTTRAATAQFGLVGALVGTAATNFRDCIAIDTRTGKLMQITPDVLRTILAETPTLLTEYEAAEKPKKSDTVYAFMVRFNQAVQLIGSR